MGSVKNLTVEEKASPQAFGTGVFDFTDDYSIFDYGKMPDQIPKKGEALCRMAAYNFRELEKLGVKTHLLEFIAPNKMRVRLVQVLRPQDNELKDDSTNYLVPLELIFRNSLPQGSSVFKRLNRGELTPEDLGLEFMPEPGIKLDPPLVDVSTKLEETDRYLDWGEAREMSRLSEEELAKLKEQTLLINDFITKKGKEIGLEHADGKVEFALMPDRQLMLVDVCGTLDEDRFLFDGVHVSKQVLRDYYKKTDWYPALNEAMEAGLSKEEWPAPPLLPKKLLQIVSNMYKSVCEVWTGERIWNAPPLGAVIMEYRRFLEEL